MPDPCLVLAKVAKPACRSGVFIWVKELIVKREYAFKVDI